MTCCYSSFARRRPAPVLALSIALTGLVACGTNSKGDRRGSWPGSAASAGEGAGGLASGAGGSSAGGSAGAVAGTGAVSEPGVLIIQEDELGFSGVDGNVLPRQGSTNVTGYTGTGFADGDSGIGKTMSWSVKAEQAGTYQLQWRYAFGGTATNLRDAELLVNGIAVQPALEFPYTNTWNDWQETAALDLPLDAGPSYIVLRASNEGGLANVDYLKVLGEGVSPETPSFTLTVDQNDVEAGSVSYAPVEDFYPAGSAIQLSAVAGPGFFFQSWTGDVTSAEPEFGFEIARNTHATALFLPEGTVADPALVGYAAIQDDAGTPYIVTGGSLGDSVTATTLEELKSYLASEEPLTVSFSGLFAGADQIQIASNKTLLGIGADAHLQGFELEINGSRNVIIRNVKVSHVIAEGVSVANDAVVITGGARNIWLDHCELFSDLDHGKDYYDGLLEIKNQASFVTVSWTLLHTHFKASLISSGDEQVADSVIRATFHHNYFHDIGSRLPSIRFGKAHVFNNYYLNADGGVNSRMGAVVKVEGNYFESVSDPIGSFDSPEVGSWDVAGNTFNQCSGSQPEASTGSLTIPYDYALDPVADVPAIVMAGAGVGKL
jgi:pectate lyase